METTIETSKYVDQVDYKVEAANIINLFNEGEISFEQVVTYAEDLFIGEDEMFIEFISLFEV